ncbi:MAG: tetratricopeptide repeat protein [Luteimonas sp.]
MPGWVLAERPPVFIPGDAKAVLERLPRGYAALMPSAGKTAPLTLIQVLLDTAARSGDARLATRAEALLARLPASDSRSAAGIKARAFAAQHRHDFAGALQLLDPLIARDPRDGDARLSRAQILLVQGRLDRARADCAALSLGIDAESGLLCVAALSLRMGNYPTAASLLDRMLAQAPAESGISQYVLSMRGAVASRAGDADADRWFERALAPAPDDVRTLAAYARHLRSRGEHRRIVHLLATAPDTDGLRLQLALAVHALDLPQAAVLTASQGRRYALAHEVGTQPEMRDEAEFLLTLRGNATAALALAQRNFESQRDYEDVDILRRAAMAAHRPDALAELERWERSQHLVPMPPSGARR